MDAWSLASSSVSSNGVDTPRYIILILPAIKQISCKCVDYGVTKSLVRYAHFAYRQFAQLIKYNNAVDAYPQDEYLHKTQFRDLNISCINLSYMKKITIQLTH